MAAYELLLLNTSIPQIQAAQSGDTYVCPRDIQITANLDVTGNTILGNASTDTVQVNGYMGVGGAGTAGNGVLVTSSALTGTSQNGVNSSVVGSSAATTRVVAFSSYPQTSDATFTVGNVIGYRATGGSKGASATATNWHGLYIDDQTQGTNNYGITSLVSSGSNKWNIYASGTAANYFAGNVGIGATPSAWSGYKVIDIASRTSLAAGASDEPNLVYNAYNNGSNWIYKASTHASYYRQIIGSHQWYTAPSGTAGNAITFTERANIGLTEMVVNDPGNDYDFRVESDTNTHALFVEGTNSNVKIGGSAERATTVGTNHLDIFDGTAPVGTLANGISIYSSSGEAYVMDAAGNATLFSPHDAETNEWIFKSKHTPTGKVLKIDVERLLKFVNDHFGLDAVQEFIED